MKTQNYATHKRFVPLYHYVLALLLLLSLIGSVVNLVKSSGSEHGLYSASLILVLNIMALLIGFFSRSFALKAQDRVIRAEENMRHYVMTGKMLPSELTMRQIIGLRFASDEEYVDLIKKAISQNLSEDAIKKSITNWRGDHERV